MNQNVLSWRGLFGWIFMLVFLTSCSFGALSRKEKRQWTSGVHTIMMDGRERTFLLDVPSQLEPGAALVFVFHGYTGSAKGMRDSSGFTALTEKHGFVAVYPQGTIDSRGNTFFNVGYAFHRESPVDDLAFARELSARLVRDLGLDPEAVFSTGMSNGGDMSYALAADDGPFVASIAPVAGTMMVAGNEAFAPQKRLSVMEVHGTDDSITRWDGDLENRDGWGAYYGTDGVMNLWVEGFDLEHYEERAIDGIPSDEKQIQRHRWWTSVDETEVILFEILTGKHTWPRNLGQANVSTAEEIWAFFVRHRESVRTDG